MFSFPRLFMTVSNRWRTITTFRMRSLSSLRLDFEMGQIDVSIRAVVVRAASPSML